MTSMRIAIRTDASINIGSGHLMRCLTLAGSLRERGCDVRFIMREHPGHLVAAVEAQGFVCHRLPTAAIGTVQAGTTHAAWLGCSQDEDARGSAEYLRGRGIVDWLIVDHYALDANWETRMRAHARCILAIDDLADRQHDCDAVLDQNLYADYEARYQTRVPSGCVPLLGPRYALLAPGFARQRATVAERRFVAPYRILAFFGGVDATNETGKFLSAWAELARTDLSADVVIGARHPHADALLASAAPLANVRMHRHVADMADMMAQSDYAFGASGVTNWERFCTGLNSTLTSVAYNQLALANDLTDLDLVDYLGDWRDTDEAAYAQSLMRLDPASSAMMQRRARIMALVDGLGTHRVVQHLMEG